MSDTFVILYDDQSSSATVEASDEGSIDAGVSRYLDSGGTRDELLHLTMTNGQRYVIRASAIQSWVVCTPEGRLRNPELQKAEHEEQRTNKQALGIWEE